MAHSTGENYPEFSEAEGTFSLHWSKEEMDAKGYCHPGSRNSFSTNFFNYLGTQEKGLRLNLCLALFSLRMLIMT